MSNSSNIAVVELGGAQHVVVPGLKFEVNRLNDYEVGSDFILTPIISTKQDESVVFGEGEVSLRLLDNKKDDKIYVMKFKAKSRYRRRTGHRQYISVVEVLSINGQTKLDITPKEREVVDTNTSETEQNLSETSIKEVEKKSSEKLESKKATKKLKTVVKKSKSIDKESLEESGKAKGVEKADKKLENKKVIAKK